jgi:uncharacterized protein (TIGR00375 family)
MPKFIADFHIHSRYSRACSKDLSIAELAKWAKLKGMGLLGTGDFTHPLWLNELKNTLRAAGNLYEHAGMRFVLSAEVNTLFYKGDKCHQIHHVLLTPSIEAAERINRELEAFGSLSLDGRPMLRMSAAQLVKIVMGIEPRSLVIAAHAWTPWFGVFGSRSGFDALQECYEDQAQHVKVLETGLSSDPAMNWRLKALDQYTLISNSDAHSAKKIGREANIFDCALDYDVVTTALKTRDRAKFLGTLEFFPEEGKYHLDGHRLCQVRWMPQETKRRGGLCSVCGKKVTVGVMHRVEDLADRPEGVQPEHAIPFQRIVPLEEIIAAALERGVGTKAVAQAYHALVGACGTEFRVLLEAPEEELHRAAAERVVEGVLRVRQGQVQIEPGYDGEFGHVRLFEEAAASVS